MRFDLLRKYDMNMIRVLWAIRRYIVSEWELWEYVCKLIIDIIKHSFIAKFNDMKPITYSEFLEDLCKQVFSSDFMCISSMHYYWLFILIKKALNSWLCMVNLHMFQIPHGVSWIWVALWAIIHWKYHSLP